MTKVDYPEGFIDGDDIVFADTFYGPLKRGAVVKVYDGSLWTTVHSGMTGLCHELAHHASTQMHTRGPI